GRRSRWNVTNSINVTPRTAARSVEDLPMSAPRSRPYGRPTTVTVAGALLIITGSLLVIGLALIGLQGTAVPMLSVGSCVAAILLMFFPRRRCSSVDHAAGESEPVAWSLRYFDR
ncbi:MAG: hypothetical protein ACR2P2_11265, partial [Nakamurella sp.]